MGSASAKWALIAPVFVPMFMLLGYTPEFAQVAYRIGDSCTNVITPMMSYFAMIIVFMKKYDKEGWYRNPGFHHASVQYLLPDWMEYPVSIMDRT